MAVDDALDLLDLLMATKLLARAERAERASTRGRLRSLPRFAAASATLAAVVRVLLEATAASEGTGPGGWEASDVVSHTAVSLAEIWARIEQVAPRRQVRAALDVVVELSPPPEEDADAAWREQRIANDRSPERRVRRQWSEEAR